MDPIDPNRVVTSDLPASPMAVQLFVRACAAFLMVGGVVGLGAVAFAFQAQGLIASGIMVGVFGGCGVVGYFLWKGAPWPVPWARILFGLQVPVLWTESVIFNFSTGIGVPIMFYSTGMNISFSLGEAFQVSFNSPVPETGFGINVIGLVCFLGLLRFRVDRQYR
jgi:hypothetical protein